MIKTGFCVAYDWELLKYSLPRVYNSSDRICLALDEDNRTWSGNSYDFDRQGFEEFVSKIDVANKIDIYYDNFSLPELNARQNCNRHRQLIAERQGTGGWHVQVDVDEYFLDFNGFVKLLEEREQDPDGNSKAVNICVNAIPVYKKLSNGYLVVDFGKSLPENFPVATNLPVYEYARRNGHFDFVSAFHVIHETWARNADELRFKISNWGHSAEELKNKERAQKYLEMWDSINESNFSNFKNIHPARPEVWPALKYIEAGSMEELIEELAQARNYLPGLRLALWNSRMVRRIISIFR